MSNSKNFDASITKSAQDFDHFLNEYLSQLKLPSKKLVEAIKYGCLNGGKRFRPFLTAQVGLVFNLPQKQCLKIAIAVELIHCYSLIHDDLPAMDDDDIRRGQPTTHKQFDEATAILAGDALQSLSTEFLAQSDLEPEIKLQLIQLLSKGSTAMVAGQVLDIQAENKDADQMSLADIETIQQNKTGALISTAALFAAILAKAPLSEYLAIKKWSENLGEAFQITDDLLDITGDSKKLGKKVNKDAALGKVTFVTLLGINGAKKRLKTLQTQATQDLNIFSERATHLHNIWHWLENRQN